LPGVPDYLIAKGMAPPRALRFNTHRNRTAGAYSLAG
jgi:hypothetical protein